MSKIVFEFIIEIMPESTYLGFSNKPYDLPLKYNNI